LSLWRPRHDDAALFGAPHGGEAILPKRTVILFAIALAVGVAAFAMAYRMGRNPETFGLSQNFPPGGVESTLESPDLACGRFNLAVEANGPTVRISPSRDAVGDSALSVERSRRAITIVARAQTCSYRLTIEKHDNAGSDVGFTLF
jgi:hypothetical protein